MDRQTFKEVSRLIAPLKRRLRLIATRAVVSLITDSKGMQRAQVTGLAGEAMDPEHMQPGGLSHVPLPGAEGVFLAVGGARDDGVVICISDRRYRPKGLQLGETALYNDAPAATQCVITLKADGSVLVEAPQSVSIKAPTVQMSASGAPVEPFVKGQSMKTALDTWKTALGVYLTAVATPTSTTSALATYEAAATAAFLALDAALSQVIQGE